MRFSVGSAVEKYVKNPFLEGLEEGRDSSDSLWRDLGREFKLGAESAKVYGPDSDNYLPIEDSDKSATALIARQYGNIQTEVVEELLENEGEAYSDLLEGLEDGLASEDMTEYDRTSAYGLGGFLGQRIKGNEDNIEEIVESEYLSGVLTEGEHAAITKVFDQYMVKD